MEKGTRIALGSALVLLFLLSLSCSPKQPDDTKIRRALTQKAEAGDPESQFQLGEMCLYGRGFERNAQPTLQVGFVKRQSKGHGGAQLNLGTLYATGEGVEKDLAEALRLFRSALPR